MDFEQQVAVALHATAERVAPPSGTIWSAGAHGAGRSCAGAAPVLRRRSADSSVSQRRR